MKPFRCNLVIEVLDGGPASIPDAIEIYDLLRDLAKRPVASVAVESVYSRYAPWIPIEPPAPAPEPKPRRRKSKPEAKPPLPKAAAKPKAKGKVGGARQRRSPMRDAIIETLSQAGAPLTTDVIVSKLIGGKAAIAQGVDREVLKGRVRVTLAKLAVKGTLTKPKARGTGYSLATTTTAKAAASGDTPDTSDAAVMAAVDRALRFFLNAPSSINVLSTWIHERGWPGDTKSLRKRLGLLMMDRVADGTLLMNAEGFRLAT